MATSSRVTSRVLTPEEAEARRKRFIKIIEKVELELSKREGTPNEQAAK
jgi:hypothetical protein